MRHVVVLPTYNEASNLPALIEEIYAAVPDADVLVVDDASPDGTAGVVRALRRSRPSLHLLERERKDGLGSASKAAFRHVLDDPGVETVTTMDADFSHPPSILPVLRTKAETYDVVVGSRYVPGGAVPSWELWRRILSRAANLYAGAITGVPVKDLTAGFVCFRRRALEKIDLDRIDSAGYAYLIESKSLAHQSGATIVEVPIEFAERRGGESKISNGVIWEGLIAPWRVRRSGRRPRARTPG